MMIRPISIAPSALLLGLAAAAVAQPPSLSNIEPYLVIGMASDSDTRPFQTSCSEVGADRIVLSTTSSPTWTPLNGCLPNLVSVFGSGRWNTATNPDSVTGAEPLFQGIDHSGNIALTSTNSVFDSSNSLFFTGLGIRSGRTSGTPEGSISNTSHYFSPNLTPVPNAVSLANGISINNSFAPLLSDLAAWKTFINALAADLTITSLSSPFDFTDVLATNGTGGLRTTFNNANADPVIVVDFMINGDFSLTNLDWVIDSAGTGVNGPLIVFRVKNGSNMSMQNTSILMHESDITATKKVGAIFYHASESNGSGDTVFTVGNNTVLNGLALWDLNAVGAGGSVKTNININNGQGCSQFISQKVNMQNSRWVRCAPASVAQARISIDPDDVNRVGESHTFAVLIEADTGAGFVPVNVNEAVTVTLTNANGAVNSISSNTCANGTGDVGDTPSEATGQCFVAFTSNTTGTVTGNASATVMLGGGFNIPVTTQNGNSPTGPAVKRFVDARISIDPDDVNRVGDPHTFVVTIEADAGNGTGFAAVDVAAVTVGLSGAPINVVDNCANGTGDAGDVPAEAVGQCTVTFTSSTPGTVIGSASATVALTTPQGNINVPVSTTDANSPTGNAVKRFVDARISIDPDDVNGIGEPHTFTVLVEANSGAGWAAIDVAAVTLNLVDGDGAVNVVDFNTCANGTGDAGDAPPEATGVCAVKFTSNTTGTVTGSASATVSLNTPQGTINLPVSTSDANSPTGSSVKRFVDGSLFWEKEDGGGSLLGGATFQVCRTHDRHGADIVDECATVLDDAAPDTDADAGQFLLVDLKLGRYTIEETIAPLGYSLDPTVITVEVGSGDPLDLDSLDVAVDYVWVNRTGVCLLILDEDTVDNGISSVIAAANGHGEDADWLVNDNDPVKGVPTLVGNPALNWNDFFAGDEVLLPGGQVKDEGWFALPKTIQYADGAASFPFTDLAGNTIATSDEWIAAFAAGTLPQDKLDKVRDVMPLRNHELAALVGETCVAIVYDSDISINYLPLYANLQGARYGAFTFTVLAVEVPGSIPESGSGTDLYDLWLRVEQPSLPGAVHEVNILDQQPDTVAITHAVYDAGLLTVRGTSSLQPGAVMTISVEGGENPKTPAPPPFVLEAPMPYVPADGRYEFELLTGTNLDGRRVTISSDLGGTNTVVIQ